MENYWSLCLYLWLIGFASLQSTVGQESTSDHVFIEEPRSTTVLLDDTVSLICRVNTSLPQTQVSWRNSKNNEINANTAHKHNFRMKSDWLGQYDLEIIGVALEDADSYYCTVKSGSENHYSRVAALSVRQEVVMNKLSCFVSINEHLKERDNVVLNCAMRTDNPNLSLFWEKNGRRTFVGVSERWPGDSMLTVRKLELELTLDDDQSEYRCVAVTSTGIMQTACVLDPLNVQYIPKVTIVPSPKQYSGYKTTYTCRATGNPDPYKYEWYVSNVKLPMNDLARYGLSADGKVMTISESTKGDNGQQLRCDVTNDMGTGQGFHIMKLDDIMSLIGPIVVGVILFAVVIIVCVFLIWWRRAPSRASDTSAHHRITTVWAANGSAIQPHKGFDQQHDGRGKIDGKPKYRKGRSSTTASRASTQPDEDDLVSPEMLEMTQPASPDDNVAYVYDGSLPGSRPETPKLWNIPRDGGRVTAEGDDIDSGQASRDNDDSSFQSENHDGSVTDVGDGTPNPPKSVAQVVPIPPSPPPAPPPPESQNSDHEDELPSFDVSEGSVSTFQAIDPPPPPADIDTASSTQGRNDEGLVYADLAFNPDRPSAPVPEAENTEYAAIDFNRASTVEASEVDSGTSNGSDITTEL
ncbi:uncharacterized protein [Ptychodera flava]|uniref:uncharacterized protein n=1 Tax=Ptychodera flava TaxID=63121 RepID=UPI003969D20F